MISPEYLSESFGRNVAIVRMQADGVSQAESLAQLPFRGNCLNWLVGHLLTGRNSILRLLGRPPAFPPESAARYERESEPILADGPGVLPLEELLAALDRSQEQIAAAIAALTPAEIERRVALFGRTERSVGEWLLFFYFHDSYHVGQTEILRQAAGKGDKVI